MCSFIRERALSNKDGSTIFFHIKLGERHSYTDLYGTHLLLILSFHTLNLKFFSVHFFSYNFTYFSLFNFCQVYKFASWIMSTVFPVVFLCSNYFSFNESTTRSFTLILYVISLASRLISWSIASIAFLSLSFRCFH